LKATADAIFPLLVLYRWVKSGQCGSAGELDLVAGFVGLDPRGVLSGNDPHSHKNRENHKRKRSEDDFVEVSPYWSITFTDAGANHGGGMLSVRKGARRA
jgi:hypothetical protein